MYREYNPSKRPKREANISCSTCGHGVMWHTDGDGPCNYEMFSEEKGNHECPCTEFKYVIHPRQTELNPSRIPWDFAQFSNRNLISAYNYYLKSSVPITLEREMKKRGLHPAEYNPKPRMMEGPTDAPNEWWEQYWDKEDHVNLLKDAGLEWADYLAGESWEKVEEELTPNEIYKIISTMIKWLDEAEEERRWEAEREDEAFRSEYNPFSEEQDEELRREYETRKMRRRQEWENYVREEERKGRL